ncbi:hypothetical protein [Vreelandella utahensis]|uniref:hypothetical protein n=1 Tax=Vreelandella halophila TaxID=86177 RepID=UPI00117B3CD9|nr:hypothetical protein [Halomonas utahensis]
MAKGMQARSDELPSLRSILSNQYSAFGIAEILQVPLIVDASAIVSDIRWLARADNPDARTNLLEAIDAETILAYAPTFLEQEVEAKIQDLHEREGIGVKALEEQWERFRSKLNLVECGGPDETYHDPKDAPYVKLHEKIEAPISGRDVHFEKMGVPLVHVSVIATAKKYSREAAVEYSIKVAGIGSIVITAAMIDRVWQLVRHLGVQAQRLPSWVWLLAIGVACAALTSERVQNWLMEQGKVLGPSVGEAAVRLIDKMEPLFREHFEYQQRANNLRNALMRGMEL